MSPSAPRMQAVDLNVSVNLLIFISVKKLMYIHVQTNTLILEPSPRQEPEIVGQ